MDVLHLYSDMILLSRWLTVVKICCRKKTYLVKLIISDHPHTYSHIYSYIFYSICIFKSRSRPSIAIKTKYSTLLDTIGLLVFIIIYRHRSNLRIFQQKKKKNTLEWKRRTFKTVYAVAVLYNNYYSRFTIKRNSL